jgi:hypothetical protein
MNIEESNIRRKKYIESNGNDLTYYYPKLKFLKTKYKKIVKLMKL